MQSTVVIMANPQVIEELEGSDLGTKDYWDDRYKMEIRNYSNNGDVGEIWFEESISQDRIVRTIAQKLEIATDEKIIDVGKVTHTLHVSVY